MTNSDRLQEIRERVEKATPGPWQPTDEELADYRKADQYFIAASRADIPYLLQLVTEQQNEISWLRTWIFRLHDPETAAQKILKLTEEPMTIEQIRDYLGIEAKGYRKQERPI
jgi:hypothetical protein